MTQTLENAKNALGKASAKAAARKGGAAGLKGIVNQMAPAIKKALPSVMTPDRFTRIVLTALSSNPELQACTPESFCGAMMTAAQLGLEPNTPLGQAYLIPYRNNRKGVTECQFQLGYKGLIDLAYRSGQIKSIQAQTVYSNDEFDYELGLEPKLYHKPAISQDRGEPVFFYAVFHTKDGGYGFDVMSVEDIRKHRDRYSKARNNGPWKTNFEEMAKKTVLKQALKYAPLKTDFVREVNTDESIKNVSVDSYMEEDTSIIDLPNEIEYEVEEEAEPNTNDNETGQATFPV